MCTTAPSLAEWMPGNQMSLNFTNVLLKHKNASHTQKLIYSFIHFRMENVKIFTLLFNEKTVSFDARYKKKTIIKKDKCKPSTYCHFKESKFNRNMILYYLFHNILNMWNTFESWLFIKVFLCVWQTTTNNNMNNETINLMYFFYHFLNFISVLLFFFSVTPITLKIRFCELLLCSVIRQR